MKEAVGFHTGEKLEATFFRGTTAIDAVWNTDDLEIAQACAMPVGFGVGDHRLFVVDFSQLSWTSTASVRPQARRLNNRIEGAGEVYVDKLEDHLGRHNISPKLVKAHRDAPHSRAAQEEVNKLDKLSEDLMKNAKHKCRKIKNGRIPFSPESSVWIRRCQVYRSLIKFKAGNIRNRGNLKRRCKIRGGLGLSVEELRRRLDFCKRKCEYFRKHGKRYRQRHLQKCLKRSQERQDEEGERKILQIIKREKDKAFWRRLNFILGKHKRNRGVDTVEVEGSDGSTRVHTQRDKVQQVIWSEVHEKKFYMAERAPICKGNLRGQFGYRAATPAAEAVLVGTYDYEANAVDQATRDLLEECAMIREVVPKDSVSIIITRRKCQAKWAKAREDTSSSISKLHFGHYIARAKSIEISAFHALKTTIALLRGFPLDRWTKGLSVMLEKLLGVRLVTRLRAILLMEADFNASNKLVFADGMLDNARKYKLMPDEIVSERGRIACDGSLANVLFFDIVRQLRVPASLGSVDAGNCYGSIAHAIGSLVNQAFGVPLSANEAMFKALEDMKFFLRTAFGDSKDFAGSTIEFKTQGY
ncbi:LOW QUALITY PROTEIN: hypothetical protein ACHAWF_016219, partial [Thalassiosira exigua]